MGGKGSSPPAKKTEAPNIDALTPKPQESTVTAAQQNRFEGNESPQLLRAATDDEEDRRRQQAALLS